MGSYTCIRCNQSFDYTDSAEEIKNGWIINGRELVCSKCIEKESKKNIEKKDDGKRTVFETGAYRDTSQGKLDYRGALSPLVLKRFVKYLLGCATMPDGSFRPCPRFRVSFHL